MPTRSCLLAPLLLMLCAVSLTAQEYRYEMGGYVGAASYLGNANRRIPFAPIGGTGGVAFRYNHNFRLAFRVNWATASSPSTVAMRRQTIRRLGRLIKLPVEPLIC